MKTDRHVQVLDGRPESVEGRVTDPPSAPRCGIGRQIDRPATGVPRSDDFFDGTYFVDEGDMGDRHQAHRVVGTEVDDIAVVGPCIGSGQRRFGHEAFPTDAERRIQQRDVDALVIHDDKARCGVVATRRASVLVAKRAAPIQGGSRLQVDATHAGQSVAHPFDRMPVNEEDLVTALVNGDADGPFPVGRVDVLDPRGARLEDMTVGVDTKRAFCGHA